MLPPLAKSIIVVQSLLTSTIIMGGFASYLLSFACTYNTHKFYDAAASLKTFSHKDYRSFASIRMGTDCIIT